MCLSMWEISEGTNTMTIEVPSLKIKVWIILSIKAFQDINSINWGTWTSCQERNSKRAISGKTTSRIQALTHFLITMGGQRAICSNFLVIQMRRIIWWGTMREQKMVWLDLFRRRISLTHLTATGWCLGKTKTRWKLWIGYMGERESQINLVSKQELLTPQDLYQGTSIKKAPIIYWMRIVIVTWILMKCLNVLLLFLLPIQTMMDHNLYMRPENT